MLNDSLNVLYRSAQSSVKTQNTNYLAGLKANKKDLKGEIDRFNNIAEEELFNVTTFNLLVTQATQLDAELKANGLPGMDAELRELSYIETNFNILIYASSSLFLI